MPQAVHGSSYFQPDSIGGGNAFEHTNNSNGFAPHPSPDDTFTGTSGDNTITGTSGADTIFAQQSGNDTVNASGGDDDIQFGNTFAAGDKVNGGSGNDDTLFLSGGAYAAGLTVTSTMLKAVEQIELADGYSYHLVLKDGVIGSATGTNNGNNMFIDGYALTAGHDLYVDASDATSSHTVYVAGGLGNDTLIGGAGNDDLYSGAFTTTSGGNDTIRGNGGADYISMTGDLTPADRIDGGSGGDLVSLAGDYSAGMTLNGTMLKNIEDISLRDDFDYKFTTTDDLVASGKNFEFDGSGVLAGHSVTIDGAAETDGTFFMMGGAGNDALTAGAGADTLLGNGGNDVLKGGAGADNMEGDAGNDTYYVDNADDYVSESVGGGTDRVMTSVSYALSAGQEIESLSTTSVGGTASINLTGNAFGQTIAGNAAANVLRGGGGNDAIFGEGGNDLIYLGAALTAAGRIDGGTGTDIVYLAGNYATTPLTFSATTMVNVERLILSDGFNYTLTTNNATVAAGQTLLVDASSLGAGHRLIFSGAAESDGHFTVVGGAGADILTGGALGDTITGGTGGDRFVYASAAPSTSSHFDTLSGVDFAADRFDIPGAIGTVTGIDTTIGVGSLSVATFDADLHGVLNGTANHLAAHHAILFRPNTGNYAGQYFLVVDVNGHAGYDAGADLVFHLSGQTGALAAGDFI